MVISAARYEHKYLLTAVQAHSLKSVFLDGLKLRVHAYPVSSVYFDRDDFEFFRQKVEGEFKHVKVRLRQYKQRMCLTEPAWLEAKIKVCDRLTKERVLLGSLDLGLKYHNWQKNQNVWREQIMAPLMPTCVVSYQRQAIDLVEGERVARITFDSNLKVQKPGMEQRVPLLSVEPIGSDFFCEPKVLMEVKTQSELYPLTLQTALDQVSSQKSTFSKYSSAMIKLYGTYFGNEELNLSEIC